MVVDENRHQHPIDEEHHRPAASHEVHLIPSPAYGFRQRRAIGKRRQQLRQGIVGDRGTTTWPAFARSGRAAPIPLAPELLDECADVGITVVEVRLIPTRLPLRLRPVSDLAEARGPELDAAVRTSPVQLDFELELEILRLGACVQQIDGPRRRIGFGLHDNGAGFDVPEVH
jgi:hypothetical protein